MLFPYFVYIMHLTKFTCGSSLLMKRPLVMEGKHWLKKNNNKKKENRPKEERQCTILSQHNKNYFMKATSTGRAPCWQPHKVSFSLCKYQPWYKNIKNCPELCFECCLWISYLAAQHILQFSHFCCGFCPWLLPLPLATLLIIVSSSVTLPWAIKIKKIYIYVCNGLLFLGNLDPLSLTPWGRIVPLVLLFQERR